jgi:microcompartment protein CcmL/EutN
VITAVGFIELSSIARGFTVADSMLKAAAVELIEAKPTCPGKFSVLVAGEVAAVTSAVETGASLGGEYVVDEFVLPNVHPAVIRAIGSANEITQIKALGIIESFSIAALIEAADAAVKSADVELIEIRNGLGIGGKSFVTMTGDVSSVQASLDVGANIIGSKGMLVCKEVIASPHLMLKESLL